MARRVAWNRGLPISDAHRRKLLWANRRRRGISADTHKLILIVTRGDGTRSVRVGCRCAVVSRLLGPKEPVELAVIHLRAEHFAMARACPHRSPLLEVRP